jgi:hypothetical protein
VDGDIPVGPEGVKVGDEDLLEGGLGGEQRLDCKKKKSLKVILKGTILNKLFFLHIYH